jgi:hypothetical protein
MTKNTASGLLFSSKPKVGLLNCSFRCGQINNSHSYEYGNTLLYYFGLTGMFNKGPQHLTGVPY